MSKLNEATLERVKQTAAAIREWIRKGSPSSEYDPAISSAETFLGEVLDDLTPFINELVSVGCVGKQTLPDGAFRRLLADPSNSDILETREDNKTLLWIPAKIKRSEILLNELNKKRSSTSEPVDPGQRFGGAR